MLKHIDVISLFPDMYQALSFGIPGRAQKSGLVSLSYWNPRDYTEDKHRTVDDRPYGGGPGMLMKVKPLREAIKAARQSSELPAKVIYLSPQGKVLQQADLNNLLQNERLILLAGRYEGIDERVIDADIDEEWSIGDYVLSGGELPSMVLIDGLVRLIPGALGHDESASQDSFYQGLLDHPHYTRPEAIDGRSVPEVLLSGDHKAIEQWRMKQALGRTWLRRPELLEKIELTELQQKLLQEFIDEQAET